MQITKIPARRRSAAPMASRPGLVRRKALRRRFGTIDGGHPATAAGGPMEFGEAADGSPLAVIYWYTFDSMGNPIFMVGSGVPDGQQVNVAFVSPNGMIYGEFDPNTVERPDGGTAYFVFEDADNATFSYTPSEFSESEWGHTTPIENLPLVKLFGTVMYLSHLIKSNL